jgi:hypothetical protein
MLEFFCASGELALRIRGAVRSLNNNIFEEFFMTRPVILAVDNPASR